MENNSNSKNNMNILIGNTLRIGVLLACVIALLGVFGISFHLQEWVYQTIRSLKMVEIPVTLHSVVLFIRF